MTAKHCSPMQPNAHTTNHRNPDMVNEWTSNDVPSVSSLDLCNKRPDLDICGKRSGAAVAFEAMVKHLNVHYPRPRPVTRDDLPPAAEAVTAYLRGRGSQTTTSDALSLPGIHAILDAVVDRLNANGGLPAERRYGDVVVGGVPAPHELACAQREIDRWRRAHEIVEGERDQARRERDKWEEKYLDTDEALHQARASLHEACKVAQSYKVDAYQATERAEAAESRTAPAVTRDDIEECVYGSRRAGRECDEQGFVPVHIQEAVDQLCDVFGVEAGQATDPVTEKADELFAIGWPELVDASDDARNGVREGLARIARHVLGQEAKR